MKKKIRLQTVLKIKKHLETLIEETYSDIQKYNKTTTKVDGLFTTALKLEEQLIIIKEAVQKANQGRHRTGRTNNYYIYKYSTLLTKKRCYLSIKGKSTDVYQISPGEAKVRMRKVDAELETISNKLSNFNLRKRITVTFDATIDLGTLLNE